MYSRRAWSLAAASSSTELAKPSISTEPTHFFMLGERRICRIILMASSMQSTSSSSLNRASSINGWSLTLPDRSLTEPLLFFPGWLNSHTTPTAPLTFASTTEETRNWAPRWIRSRTGCSQGLVWSWGNFPWSWPTKAFTGLPKGSRRDKNTNSKSGPESTPSRWSRSLSLRLFANATPFRPEQSRRPESFSTASGGAETIRPVTGWSCISLPTPGRSETTGIPCSSKCSFGPIDDSISSCGVAMAPALKITSFAAHTSTASPSGSSSCTPRALVPSSTTRVTKASEATVRLGSPWRISGSTKALKELARPPADRTENWVGAAPSIWAPL
mmetsp:Transcript_19883/g.44233  ORF Transcript_19883/g.44233 Transcript_19883/m.44233 type:complete len:330 (+) Transcript_19883:563-1552(+)